MKKNLFFDVGSTLLHPSSGNWFITPNFFNILGEIELDIVLDAIKNSLHLLDEREINTEDEEYDMFCKFYLNVLQNMNYPDITDKKIHALAYDNVYNNNKVTFYPEVKSELVKLAKEYDLYIISDAWPSTYRILQDYGIFHLFKKVYISSEHGYKKSDKKLFEIVLNDIDKDAENYFVDDRPELLEISKEYGFIPVLIDRNKNLEYIEINDLKDLNHILKL